ncbi:nitrosoguanidine resistance protein Sng1p [[Candida] anglica]
MSSSMSTAPEPEPENGQTFVSQGLAESASSHDYEADPVKPYAPTFPADDDNIANESLHRTSTIQKIQSRVSFFNEKLKSERMGLAWKFFTIYVTMGFFVLGIFTIYWGSMYNRNSRLKNLSMLVVIDNDTPVNGLPTIGDGLRDLLQSKPATEWGSWKIYNREEFGVFADKYNNTIEEQMRRDVHHQKYWSSIYVRENATINYYNALASGDASYNVTANSITVIYETGRDFLNMNQYVTPSIQKVEKVWLAKQSSIIGPLVDSLSNTQKSTLFSQSNYLDLVATPFIFQYNDYIPYTDPVLVAPSQVGLIYMIILTFFNVNFFMDVHKSVAQLKLKSHHFLIYRLLSSLISYAWLSLMYSFVTLSMQVDFTVAFGKSGFLVYWMVSWVTMWCVGSVNEVMAMGLSLVHPPLIGFWLLFWVIVNISPTFTPLALSPKIFRYGYALPLHNSYEITKVIFFDTWKGELGRNFGILAAWSVTMIFVFLGMCVLFGKTMTKRAKEAAEAELASTA